MVIFIQVSVSLGGHIIIFVQSIITVLPEKETKARPKTTEPDEEQNTKDNRFNHCLIPQV